jgi:predicted enzyme related to lactoylglutathione lyase
MANPVVHFDIGCRDRGAASDFCGRLFDWRMEEAGPATIIRTGGDVGPVDIPQPTFAWFRDSGTATPSGRGRMLA